MSSSPYSFHFPIIVPEQEHCGNAAMVSSSETKSTSSLSSHAMPQQSQNMQDATSVSTDTVAVPPVSSCHHQQHHYPERNIETVTEGRAICQDTVSAQDVIPSTERTVPTMGLAHQDHGRCCHNNNTMVCCSNSNTTREQPRLGSTATRASLDDIMIFWLVAKSDILLAELPTKNFESSQ